MDCSLVADIPSGLKLVAGGQGETSVACLADLAETAPTVVSQHLAKLRLAGLVKTRREGTFVYYSPADQDILRILSQALLGTDTISHETGAVEKG